MRDPALSVSTGIWNAAALLQARRAADAADAADLLTLADDELLDADARLDRIEAMIAALEDDE